MELGSPNTLSYPNYPYRRTDAVSIEMIFKPKTYYQFFDLPEDIKLSMVGRNFRENGCKRLYFPGVDGNFRGNKTLYFDTFKLDNVEKEYDEGYELAVVGTRNADEDELKGWEKREKKQKENSLKYKRQQYEALKRELGE